MPQKLRITMVARGCSRPFALPLGLALLCPATAAAGFRVHAPEEVLEGWTVHEGDRLYFRDPGGRLWELVTQIDDPAIVNTGMGDFFPVEPALVEEALSDLSYPVAEIQAEVFLLPYPRRDLLDSSTEGGAIVLSPGVAPLSTFQVHMLVAHEVGHVVHQQLLPDADGEGWATFRRLRGIEDGSVYNATAAHKNRPHEIFAEDFRVLFGGPDAQSGGVENRDLVPPEQVDGLRAFSLLLAEPGPKPWQRRNLVLAPNPTAGGVRVGFVDPFAATGLAPWVLSVYDVRGRLVSRTSTAAAGDLRWDGRTDRGEPAHPGVYFVRAVRGLEHWSGKLLVRR